MKVNSDDMRKKIIEAINWEPKAANDDKLLMSIIWQKEGWDRNGGLLYNLRKVSSPETIRRTRQKLVEEGIIEPAEETTEARYQEFKQVRMSI